MSPERLLQFITHGPLPMLDLPSDEVPVTVMRLSASAQIMPVECLGLAEAALMIWAEVCGALRWDIPHKDLVVDFACPNLTATGQESDTVATVPLANSEQTLPNARFQLV